MDNIEGDKEEQQKGESTPVWVWGTIAGAAVVVATTGVAVGHRVGKWRRQKIARERVTNETIDQFTPRGGIPPMPPAITGEILL
jgi:hypothetical protein